MNSIMQKAKAERRRIILKAIKGVAIPEYQYDKQRPIPARVKELIYDLKMAGAFSFCTGEKDIWRSLYNTQLEIAGDKENNHG